MGWSRDGSTTKIHAVVEAVDRMVEPLSNSLPWCDLVPPRTLAVHRDGDLNFSERGSRGDGDILRALVDVDVVRLSVEVKRFVYRLDEKGASIVIDNRYDRTFQLNQSTTAQR